jgi:hypothetical protein
MRLTTALWGALVVFSGLVSAESSEELDAIAAAAELYPKCAVSICTMYRRCSGQSAASRKEMKVMRLTVLIIVGLPGKAGT